MYCKKKYDLGPRFVLSEMNLFLFHCMTNLRGVVVVQLDFDKIYF